MLLHQVFLCCHCNTATPQQHDPLHGLVYDQRTRIGHGVWLDKMKNMEHRCAVTNMQRLVNWHKECQSTRWRATTGVATTTMCPKEHLVEHPFALNLNTMKRDTSSRVHACGVVFPLKSLRTSSQFGSGNWIRLSKRYYDKWSPRRLGINSSINHVHLGIKELTEDSICSFLRIFAGCALSDRGPNRAVSVDSVAASDVENHGYLLNGAARPQSQPRGHLWTATSIRDFDPQGIWARPPDSRRNLHQSQDSGSEHDMHNNNTQDHGRSNNNTEDHGLNSNNTEDHGQSSNNTEDHGLNSNNSMEQVHRSNHSNGPLSITGSRTPTLSPSEHESDQGVCPPMSIFPHLPQPITTHSPLSRQNTRSSSFSGSLSLSPRRHLSPRQRMRQDEQEQQVNPIKLSVIRKCWAFLHINDLNIDDHKEWTVEAQSTFEEWTSHHGYHWRHVRDSLCRRDPAVPDYRVEDIPTVQYSANTVQQAVRNWLDGTGPEHYLRALTAFKFDTARDHFCKD